jgi:hypothetical protein
VPSTQRLPTTLSETTVSQPSGHLCPSSVAPFASTRPDSSKSYRRWLPITPSYVIRPEYRFKTGAHSTSSPAYVLCRVKVVAACTLHNLLRLTQPNPPSPTTANTRISVTYLHYVPKQLLHNAPGIATTVTPTRHAGSGRDFTPSKVA